jgi:alcohol dehydrogenase (cytochrome c)
MFNTHDSHTGAVVWQFQTGSGIHLEPGRVRRDREAARRRPGRRGRVAEGFAPNSYGVQRAGSRVVFALP